MLREIRCHNLIKKVRCENTFTTNGWRRLCDACRLVRQAEAQKRIREKQKNSPEWHKKKNAYQKAYKQRHLQKLRAYNADWMRQKRAGLPTKGSKVAPCPQKPFLEPCSAYKRCLQCAYWMLKGETVCKRCGN